MTQRNVGPITISVQAKLDKFKDALKALNEEIAKFDSPDYFTDEELEYAKTLLDVNEIYDREKPSQYAHTVSFWWASSGLDYYTTYVENLRKVTREDIRQYVRKYMKNKPRIVSALLSEEDQKRITLTEKDLLAAPTRSARPTTGRRRKLRLRKRLNQRRRSRTPIERQRRERRAAAR